MTARFSLKSCFGRCCEVQISDSKCSFSSLFAALADLQLGHRADGSLLTLDRFSGIFIFSRQIPRGGVGMFVVYLVFCLLNVCQIDTFPSCHHLNGQRLLIHEDKKTKQLAEATCRRESGLMIFLKSLQCCSARQKLTSQAADPDVSKPWHLCTKSC